MSQGYARVFQLSCETRVIFCLHHIYSVTYLNGLVASDHALSLCLKLNTLLNKTNVLTYVLHFNCSILTVCNK